MLANFFNNDQLMREFAVSFSYRKTSAYEAGFRSRVPKQFDARALELLDISTTLASTKALPGPIGGLLRAVVHLSLLRYWFVLRNTVTLYREFKDVDLLHINNGNYPGAYSCMSAVLAARLRGIEHIVYVVNNIAIPYSSPRRWLDYPIDRLVTATVSIFVTASVSAGIQLARVLRLPKGKITCMQNGISPRNADETRESTLLRLQIPGNRILIGIIAVLDPRKGHLVLLEALARLKRVRTNQSMPLPFIIIEGSGEMKMAIDDFISRSNLADDVRLIGNERNIFNLMSAVDVIALPSISHEDFPNVVLEAMYLGKPVIASRLAGIPEQIQHMESGILVECGDPDSLACAMDLVTTNAEIRERIGRAAKLRFAEHFAAEIAVNRYVALYTKMIVLQEKEPG